MTRHNNTKIYGAACYRNLVFNGSPSPIQRFWQPYYKGRSWTVLNYKKHIIWLFGSTCKPLLKISRHNITPNSKTIFYQKKVCLICHHFSQRSLILSWYYIARGETIMNYAKKIVICVNMDIFSEGIIAKISRLHRNTYFMGFQFLIFRHHVET